MSIGMQIYANSNYLLHCTSRFIPSRAGSNWEVGFNLLQVNFTFIVIFCHVFCSPYGTRKAVWYNDIYSTETTYIRPKCFNFNDIPKFSIYQIVLKFSICRCHQLHLILVGPWPGSLDFINEERI